LQGATSCIASYQVQRARAAASIRLLKQEVELTLKTNMSASESRMPARAKKATFSLREDVLAAVDEAVARGNAPSKNAFVERALVKELQELRRQQHRRQWEQAARDPLLLRDIADVESAFESADAETARRIG
jgi:Arc/MetJ-type ribon-helix-helix transcriptional regulator